MHICIYIHLPMYIYIYMYIYTYKYNVYIHIYIYTHVNRYSYVDIWMYMHLRIHVRIYHIYLYKWTGGAGMLAAMLAVSRCFTMGGVCMYLAYVIKSGECAYPEHIDLIQLDVWSLIRLKFNLWKGTWGSPGSPCALLGPLEVPWERLGTPWAPLIHICIQDCIDIYVYKYIYIYICIHIYIYICACSYIYISLNLMFIFIYIYTYIYVNRYSYVDIWMYMYVRIHVKIYHIYSYKWTGGAGMLAAMVAVSRGFTMGGVRMYLAYVI